MSRPAETPDWIPDNDPSKIIAPSASKQATGWLSGEKPAFQHFNWFWNLVSKWLQYFGRVTMEYNTIIDTPDHEGDYATLAAYLADSPAAGDRVLINTDQAITSILTIPSGIKLKMKKGVKITCSTALATVISFGNDVETEGDFLLELSHTGTIAEAIAFNGDNNSHDNLIVKNTGSGTVTTAFTVRAGKKCNIVDGQIIQTGPGGIATPLTDASGFATNLISIRDGVSNLLHTAAVLPVSGGGTGSSTPEGALVNLGLAATAAEINRACDGIRATAGGINAICEDGFTWIHGIPYHLVLGDQTAFCVMRAEAVNIRGNGGSDIDVWADNLTNAGFGQYTIGKNGSNVVMSLNADGTVLTVNTDVDVARVLMCSITFNNTGLYYIASAVVNNGVAISLTNTSGVALDLTTLALDKLVKIYILFYTC
ncbi:MAG: hypothetical protein AB1847_11225 [bacterium]